MHLSSSNPILQFLLFFLCLFPQFIFSQASTCAPTSGCVGGKVFEDFNCNGSIDTLEFGVLDMEVMVYNSQNAVVGNVMTNANGIWEVCGLTDGLDYRIEFLLPSWAKPTHTGNNNGTDVQFITAPACTEFSINNPANYCQDDPNLAVTCFVEGAYNDANTQRIPEVLVQFPLSNTADPDGDITETMPFDPNNRPYPTSLEDKPDMGAVYGIAWSARMQTIYTSSFLKYGAGYGPGGGGQIYSYDPVTNTTSSFVNLNTVFGPTTATDGVARTITTLQGEWTWSPHHVVDETLDEDEVGKQSFGDIEISDDETKLYVINMYDRHLYEIPTSGPLTTGTINRYPIPTTGLPTDSNTGTCTAADVRPGALGKDNFGNIYVGAVCSAQSTMDDDDLFAYVWQFNGSGFNLVMNGALDYTRDNNNNFEYWTADPSINNFQPLLIDIEFDNSYMILGFRSRSSDMILPYTQVNSNNNDSSANPHAAQAGPINTSMGDILLACSSGTGTWQLENNGTCSTRTSAGSNGGGPGGQEFYWEDTPGDAGFTGEAGSGGLLQIPGLGDVLHTTMNSAFRQADGTEINIANSAGIQRYDNTDGTLTGSYLIYEIGESENNFNKVSGLGDVEALCDPAPLEIGNYVWCDAALNGIQDPHEDGINDMIVQLYDATGTLIGQDTTLNGNYYFNEYNVATGGITVDGSGVATPVSAWTGLDYSTKYFIVFGDGQYDDTADEFTIGANTYPGVTTVDVNNNLNDNVDSDVDGSSLSTPLGSIPADLPMICMVTDDIGCGNHSYDMGLACGDPCYTITKVADYNVCNGDLVDLAITTTFSNPNSISFVYFNTAQTDYNTIYSGGTGLGTIPITAGNDTVQVLNVNAFTNTGTTPDTFYVYSIVQPLPVDAYCRPYAEMMVIVYPNEPYEVCDDGVSTIMLTTDPSLTNVIWYNSANIPIGSGNSIVIDTNTAGMADKIEAFHFTTDQSGCAGGSCCPITVNLIDCCKDDCLPVNLIINKTE